MAKGIVTYLRATLLHDGPPFFLSVLCLTISCPCNFPLLHCLHPHPSPADLPLDVFGTVFNEIHPCGGPLDSNCLISWDTRTPKFVPESLQSLPMGYGAWLHHFYWLVHDKYCARPPADKDDVSKGRLEINPLNWRSAAGMGDAGFLGAKKVGSNEPVLPPDHAWAKAVTVTDKAVLVTDPSSWHGKGSGDKGGPGNMHPVEMQFWFFNIRQNVAERLAAFKQR